MAGEKTLEDWVQTTLADSDALAATVTIGYIPSVGLGTSAYQLYHPVSRVLHASKTTINLPERRVEMVGLEMFRRAVEDIGISPFPTGSAQPPP